MKNIALALGLAWATLVHAGSYPSEPITVIVPFTAAGPTDRLARDLAETMRKHLGAVSMVVENVTGAGGSVGAARVAKATPDGYTILFHHIGMATMPTLVPNLSFNVESDFEYLGMVGEAPMTLVARPGLPARNFKEFKAWVAQRRGHANLGNAGVGSASHLCGLLLQTALQTEVTTVPYKGTAPAMNDLMAGQIDFLCDQTISTLGPIESKKVQVYGVTTPKRLNMGALRDVPTLQEVGLKGFDVSVWFGLYAPKGITADVLGKLNAALRAALKDPEFIRRQERLGVNVISDKRLQPGEHKRFVAAEIAKWSPIIRAAGVYAD